MSEHATDADGPVQPFIITIYKCVAKAKMRANSQLLISMSYNLKTVGDMLRQIRRIGKVGMPTCRKLHVTPFALSTTTRKAENGRCSKLCIRWVIERRTPARRGIGTHCWTANSYRLVSAAPLSCVQDALSQTMRRRQSLPIPFLHRLT